MVGRILCLFDRHQRSRSRARHVEIGAVSVCRHCGIAMRRDRNRRWIVDR